MSLDMSDTILAKSDQLNADDLVSGPITVSITDVTKTESGEQQVSIFITGGHQPFKPCKTVRRILVGAWGKDASQWIGRSLRLMRDPNVTWAGQKVGGIRIAAMSHIAKPYEVALAESRKSKKQYVIEVLTDVVAEWSMRMAEAKDLAELTQIGAQLRDAKLSKDDSSTLKTAYQRRGEELKKSPPPERHDLPAANETYQALQQRIRLCKSGSDASVIKVDIVAAHESGQITREEADELHEMLRKEMA